VEAAEDLLASHGADVYLSKCGGIHSNMKIAAIAESLGVFRTPMNGHHWTFVKLHTPLWRQLWPRLPYPCSFADDFNHILTFAINSPGLGKVHLLGKVENYENN
jgi:L-alanine-DL-glutamate epimerase-like enolase superfamily enzyme